MTRPVKDEFILRMLSKITHKKWESYTINRIIHRLDDPDVEFICQQYTSRPNGKFALIDLYFPQFNLALEVDEPPHEGKSQKENDEVREKDIIAVTDCDLRRLVIKSSDGSTPNPQGPNISLKELNVWIDNFVAELRRKKKDLGEKFIPWDYETRYDPETHIKQGSIEVNHRVAFASHRDALRCFGYKKGHFQRAVWKIPNVSSWVWFPKFYENSDWENSLSDDGKTITETYKGDEQKNFNREDPVDTRIVFAHDRDALGYTLYRFLGEFEPDKKDPDARTRHFRLVKTKVDLKKYHQ